MPRTVILHYHLFKNAGTSLDHILKSNFGDRWVTAEFPTGGNNNTPLIEEWIKSNSQAIAFSTHTAIGPIPQIEGVRIISVMLLRDPVARILSAYRFERNQEAHTWGSELAKEHDLSGYVNARLDRKNDRQCRNFQMERLAAIIPGEGNDLQRALSALNTLTFVGVVEEFGRSLEKLSSILNLDFPDFTYTNVRANVTSKPEETNADMGVGELLRSVNSKDIEIWETALKRISE